MIPERWGTVTPMLRLEYSHALTGSYAQTLSYASLPGTNYLISGIPEANDLFTSGLALRAETIGGFSTDLEYLLTGSTRNIEAQQVRASVRQVF